MTSCFGKRLYADLVSQYADLVSQSTHGGMHRSHSLLVRELSDCIVAGFQENKFEGTFM
jgi:hypothetical protein